MLFLFGGLLQFFWPVVIAGFVIFWLHQKSPNRLVDHAKNDSVFYSKEDIISQLLIILAVVFFGITLGTFNKYIGAPLSLYGVIITSVIIGAVVTYYTRIVSLGIVTLVGLFFWWGNQATLWIQVDEVRSSILLAGFIFIALLLYTLGHTHKKNIVFQRMSSVYFTFGIISLSALLLYVSTENGARFLFNMMKGNSIGESWQLLTTVVIALFLIMISVGYAMSKKLISLAEALSVLFMTAIGIVITFLSGDYMFTVKGGQVLSSTGVLMAIVLNLALFLEVLGLIFIGYVRNETTWVNLGAFALFFLIFVKYFDWFYDSFDKSLFFIGAGVLLLLTGWIMEKGRRYTLSQMKSQASNV